MKKYQLENGFSTLGVLISIAVLLVSAAGISKTVSRSIKAKHRVSLRTDVIAITKMIHDDIDCEKTLGLGLINCPDYLPNFVTLRGQNSSLTGVLNSTGFLEGAGLLFNGWQLKATCDRSNNSLLVRLAKTKGQTFQKDPHTGKPLDFSSFPALFGGNLSVPICENFFSRGGLGCDVGNLRFRNPNIQYCAADHTWVNMPNGNHNVLKTGSGDLIIDGTSALGDIQATGGGSIILE